MSQYTRGKRDRRGGTDDDDDAAAASMSGLVVIDGWCSYSPLSNSPGTSVPTLWLFFFYSFNQLLNNQQESTPSIYVGYPTHINIYTFNCSGPRTSLFMWTWSSASFSTPSATAGCAAGASPCSQTASNWNLKSLCPFCYLNCSTWGFVGVMSFVKQFPISVGRKRSVWNLMRDEWVSHGKWYFTLTSMEANEG